MPMRMTPFLRRLIPPMMHPPAKSIYYALFRLRLRVVCQIADFFQQRKVTPPLPPAFLRYKVSESLAVDEFNQIGQRCAAEILHGVCKSGFDFSKARRVLDFGCGCGRTVRWFLQQPGFPEIHGVDVDAEAIEWCRDNLTGGCFVCTHKVPPLPYQGGHFDVIYGISVFTHLNESMQDLWIMELRRVLKPDGVLIFTVHGANAAQVLDETRRTQLATNGLVHVASSKLRGIVPEWYNTTWHSNEYVLRRLSSLFQTVIYEVIPDGAQDLVIARNVFAQPRVK
jgi:SAM-dependent methyltransferase